MAPDAPGPKPPSKREVMSALLEEAEAQVHFDPRHPDVEVPAPLRAHTHVRLDYGYRLVPAIPDLLVDETGIRATLSFSRRPTPTFVPWEAVFLIADFEGRGAMWPEAMPAEVARTLLPREPATAEPAAAAAPAPTAPARPHLASVPPSEEDPPEPPGPRGPGQAGRGGHLRLVK